MNDTYIVRDQFDSMAFKEAMNAMPDEKDWLEKSTSSTWLSNVAQELYSVLYKATPRKNDNYEGDPSIINIVDGFMLSPDCEKLRQESKFNQNRSASTAMTLSRKLFEKVDNKRNPDTHYQGTFDVSDPNNEVATELRLIINEAVQEANEECEALGTAAGLLAGKDACPFNTKDVSLQHIKTLAALIRSNPEYRKLMELAGQFKQSARKQQASKLSHGVDELYEVGTGNDIQRLLPSELIKLKRNKRQFNLDFVEKKLMQYKLRGGSTPLEKGPVVCCVDMSISMLEAARHIKAKACLLTLHRICQEQKRDLHAILFNAGVMNNKPFLKKGIVSGTNIIDTLMAQPVGGTSFMYPLSEAVKIIKGYKGEGQRPDIVMLTDGFAAMDDKFIQQFKADKKEQGFSLYTYFIGKEHHPSYEQLKKVVQQLSDKYVELEDGEDYSEVFKI